MIKPLFTVLLLTAGTLLSGTSMADEVQEKPAFDPPPLQLEKLARFEVDLTAPVWELGKTSDLGKRRIIPITGGRFEGPSFKGEILNNGADWQIVTDDGLAIIDTRYLLKTDDGALVYLQTKGYRYGPPEVMKDVAAGKPVDPSQYFFKVTMTFETSSEKYDWLNRAIGVGSAMRLGKAVVYDAYLLK
ncbi:DUF3237 domain-containing protein [Pseudomonas asuensis]|uniref:UPF0311 protein GCM10009425_27390 n=1 Tax=Pseudomonas asuensis TaxID=1825787 RepID=A0ABQ2GWS8_9PSED|nr:DUF3237 domain-containing protein [Pseudomonas asuensis]GGM14922.1 UPF0311 protein [Pseudomonas asuensis]